MKKYIVKILGPILVTTVTILCTIAVFLFAPKVRSKGFNVVTKERMYSLKNREVVKGHFVLGGGRINQKNYYYFFLKDSLKNGTGYIKYRIPADETILVEKDTIPTYIKNSIKKVTTYKYPWGILGKDSTSIEYQEYSFFSDYEIPEGIKYKYILIVPKGTITENQSWDAL